MCACSRETHAGTNPVGSFLLSVLSPAIERGLHAPLFVILVAKCLAKRYPSVSPMGNSKRLTARLLLIARRDSLFCA